MVPDTDSLAYLWRSMLLQVVRSGVLVVVVFAATALAFFAYGEPLIDAVEHAVWLLLVACTVVGSSLALLCVAVGATMLVASCFDRRL